MNDFIDPRSAPSPEETTRPPRLTEAIDDLKPLHRLCQEGRLYDVERWIMEGRPLQLAPGGTVRSRTPSALEIALERGDYALAHLLLCNGYEPRLRRGSPLDVALESRRNDLLDLLLEWRADPHKVDLYCLFGTYDSSLFEQFRQLGVDLTAYHEFADVLIDHTSSCATSRGSPDTFVTRFRTLPTRSPTPSVPHPHPPPPPSTPQRGSRPR